MKAPSRSAKRVRERPQRVQPGPHQFSSINKSSDNKIDKSDLDVEEPSKFSEERESLARMVMVYLELMTSECRDFLPL